MWSLEAHGAPNAVLPAGEDGEVVIVTDLGVVHLGGPDASPDWMLALNDPAVRAEAASSSQGRFLVVGTASVFQGASSASLHVVDMEEARLVYQGRSGGEALLTFRLTDVDGDGEPDILGVDASWNLTALKLDGSLIYRVPLPAPDLPASHGLPDEMGSLLGSFLTIALERTGGTIFADATADGTLDLFVLHEYWADTEVLVSPSALVVSVVSGANGELVWSRVVEPDLEPGRFFLPAAAGDLNGDGHEDLVLTERSMMGGNVMGAGLVNLVVAGMTGTVLARDDARLVCVVDECMTLVDAYEPIAVVDASGSGERMVVGLERDPGQPWRPPKALVLRSLSQVPMPGAPTQVVAHHEIAVDASGFPLMGHKVVRELEGDGRGVVVLFEKSGNGETGKVHRLVGDEFVTVQPGEPLGHYDIDAATGQTYAWTLADDRFVPVSSGSHAQRDGEGTQLLRSVQILLGVQRDRGLDFLLPRSLGYQWISGETGRTIGVVERPADVRGLGALLVDGNPFVVESQSGDLMLYDVERERETWRLSEGERNGAALRAVGDLTGDGAVEVLLRVFPGIGSGFGGRDGGTPDVVPGSWKVVSPTTGEVLWELEGDDIVVVPVDVSGAGMDLLVMREDGDGTRVALHQVGGDGPLWDRDHADARFVDDAKGRILLKVHDGEGGAFLVLDADSGAVFHRAGIADDELGVWGRLLDLDGRDPHLVYSVGREHPLLPGAMTQSVIVLDPAGEALTEFELSLPEVLIHRSADGSSRSLVRWAQPGPLLGDWDNGGWEDLGLQEGGLAVVRSLRDGEVLAVAPREGSFVDAFDVTGDGRKEAVLLSRERGSLRLYGFDPSQVDLEREDPLARFHENQTEDGDLEDPGRSLPAPSLGGALVLLMGGLLATRYRWINRR